MFRFLHFAICTALLTSTAIAQVPYAVEIFPANISGAVCGFNKEGNRMYFVREDTTNQKLFLYEADWNGSKWINARLLPFSGHYNDYGGRLTPEGSTFYFASDRPGASDNRQDLWNIWKVTKSSTGWNEPEPLKELSNKGDECCPVPFIDGEILFSGTSGKSEWQIYKADNSSVSLQSINVESAWQWPSYYDLASRTLFFNSMKRSDTKGKDDIYVANFVDGKWSPVRNLQAVNTAVYEDGAILSPDRRLLIFCRHETGATPSRVLCIKIEEVLKDFNK